MRLGLAAKRLIVFAVLGLAGVSSSAAVAGAIDPVGTVTSAISTIAGETTVVSDLTEGVSGSGSGSSAGSATSDPVSGVVGSVTGSATDLLSGTSGGGGTIETGATVGTGGTAGGSGTGAVDGLSGGAGSGGTTTGSPTPRARTYTRFDRLPRRYETLLERIELGRNVRANIARLRTLLASASPEFRARILRLIRREIHRLEKGGLTRRERLAIRRLHRLFNALNGRGLPPPAPTPTSAAWFERPGLEAVAAGGVLGAGDSQPRATDQTRRANGPRADGQDGGLPFVLPAPPSAALYWLALVLLGTVICALLLLALSSQRPLPIPMRGAVAARAPQLRALGLMMAFVGALGIYLVVLLA